MKSSAKIFFILFKLSSNFELSRIKSILFRNDLEEKEIKYVITHQNSL